jgi:hypothetical protein
VTTFSMSFASDTSQLPDLVVAHYCADRVFAPYREGRLPEGVERIEASTPHVNFLFRVYVAGPDDFEAANSLRRQVKLYPLSDLAAD